MGDFDMSKRVCSLLIATVIFIGIIQGRSLAADIPREGNIEVPAKKEAIAICRKNPYIDNNMLLAGCVKMEQEGARSILRMIRSSRDNASEAYWNCVKNPYIDTYSLLSGCMQQELEAKKFLSK
jgi:hypothetical protein